MEPIAFARTGALRYFDAVGAFAEDLAAHAGGPLPQPLRAVHYAAEGAVPDSGEPPGIILAFRSPTETWVLCNARATFEAIERFAAQRSDGCLVEQTGGTWCCRVSGARAADFLARLGSSVVVPGAGQAFTGRFADVTATCVCVRAGEVILIADRAYADHLTAWMSATLDDFTETGARD
jgi:sarcosine oxidase gamma subunit